jgi:hypothetical protein
MWRSFSPRLPLGRVAMGQQHAELVAAQPRHDVAAAQGLAHAYRELAQQLVPGLVAAGIVDHLELVQVEIEQTVAHALFLADTGPGLFERVVETVAVEQPGQAVVAGLPGQLGGGGPHLFLEGVVGGLEFGGHAVDAFLQHGELASALHLHPGHQVARADPFDGAGQHGEGAHDIPAQSPCQQAGQGQTPRRR